MANDIKIEQPAGGGSDTGNRKRVTSGMPESVRALKNLEFDPITRLVDLYHKLIEEEKVFSKIRSGELVLLKDNGKERPYSGVAHAAIFAQLEKVTADLLRYKYGRVPETIIIDESDKEQGFSFVLPEEDDDNAVVLEHKKEMEKLPQYPIKTKGMK
jgi:hypothetical protein